MPEDVEKYYDQAIEILTTYGFSVLGAIIILILGFWFAGLAKPNRGKSFLQCLSWCPLNSP